MHTEVLLFREVLDNVGSLHRGQRTLCVEKSHGFEGLHGLQIVIIIGGTFVGNLGLIGHVERGVIEQSLDDGLVLIGSIDILLEGATQTLVGHEFLLGILVKSEHKVAVFRYGKPTQFVQTFAGLNGFKNLDALILCAVLIEVIIKVSEVPIEDHCRLLWVGVFEEFHLDFHLHFLTRFEQDDIGVVAELERNSIRIFDRDFQLESAVGRLLWIHGRDDRIGGRCLRRSEGNVGAKHHFFVLRRIVIDDAFDAGRSGAILNVGQVLQPTLSTGSYSCK